MPTMTTVVRDTLYIGGAWVPSSGSGSIEVIDSTTEAVIGTVPEGTVEDIDRAVAAAADAFPAWSATPVAERTALLTAVGEAAGRPDGCPGRPHHPRGGHATGPVPAGPGRAAHEQLRRHGPGGRRLHLGADQSATRWWSASPSAWWAPSPRGTTRSTRSPPRWPRRWPPGARWCSSPARWHRSTPSCWPRSSSEVGLPAGVFNLVTGFGPVVGEAIAAHPDVDMVSFTGSTRAGRRVSEVASATVKRVALELGGKSANVILDDADLSPGGARRDPQVLHQLGADLQCADPDAGPSGPVGRGRGVGHGGRRVVHPGRSLRRRDHGSARWCRPSSGTGSAPTSTRGSGRGPGC